MIDLEPVLFNRVATELRAAFPGGIFVAGEVVAAPPSFPCVSIVEISNTTYRRSLDSGKKENHANLAYEFNIFSNKIVGKKTECRAIAAVADDVMLDSNFTRTMLEPVTNLADASIYRVVARYEAVVSAAKIFFRR